MGILFYCMHSCNFRNEMSIVNLCLETDQENVNRETEASTEGGAGGSEAKRSLHSSLYV